MVAQTFEVTFVMPRPEQWNILPGMTATVEVEMTKLDDALQNFKIPTSALVTDAEKQFFVWTYDPTTQLVEKTAVTVGPADGEGINVLSGLVAGDLIVASGAAHLQKGMKVRMLGEPMADL